MADLISLQTPATEFEVDRSTLHRQIKLGNLKRWKREMVFRTHVNRDELRELLEFRTVEE